ncbi:hypothetical protein B224_4218 [Aeromonas media WS]|nr:hypothetical protein B224_4218 [Aeromonas media WS]
MRANEEWSSSSTAHIQSVIERRAGYRCEVSRWDRDQVKVVRGLMDLVRGVQQTEGHHLVGQHLVIVSRNQDIFRNA